MNQQHKMIAAGACLVLLGAVLFFSSSKKKAPKKKAGKKKAATKKTPGQVKNPSERTSSVKKPVKQNESKIVPQKQSKAVAPVAIKPVVKPASKPEQNYQETLISPKPAIVEVPCTPPVTSPANPTYLPPKQAIHGVKKPAAVVAKPEAVVAKPAAVVAKPAKPESVVAKPEAVVAKPAAVVAKPAKPESVVAKPEAVVPEVVVAKPAVKKPAAVVAKPDVKKPAVIVKPETAAKPVAKPESPVSANKPNAEEVKPQPKPAAISTPEKKKAVEAKTGIMRIMNIKGKGLANKDKFSAGDPYFVFKCGKQTLKTQRKSGSNPTFTERFSINVTDANAVLELSGMDWDRFSTHDSIGFATQDVAVFRQTKNATTYQFDLMKKGKNGSQGKIMFDCVWEPARHL